jgi:hypothetical protein
MKKNIILISLLFLAPNLFAVAQTDYIKVGMHCHEYGLDLGGGVGKNKNGFLWFGDQLKYVGVYRTEILWGMTDVPKGIQGRSPGTLGPGDEGSGLLFYDYFYNILNQNNVSLQIITHSVPVWCWKVANGCFSGAICGPFENQNNDAGYGDPTVNEDLPTSYGAASDMLQWQDWITRLATRYPLTKYWVFGNEPNLDRTYADGNPGTGLPTPWTDTEAAYQSLFIYGYNPIKTRIPDAVVFPSGYGGPGIGPGNYGNIVTGYVDCYGEDTAGVSYRSQLPSNKGYAERFMDSGVRNYFNAAGIHQYKGPDTKTGGPGWADMYNTARRVYAAHGYPNMPIMDDESGHPWYVDSSPTLFNETNAATEVSDQIGTELTAGCNYIVTYVGVDDPPGCSWDAYFGLRKYCMPFSYQGMGYLDTKEKQLGFLNNIELRRWGNGLYGPYTDLALAVAKDNSGYIVTGIKDKNGTWRNYPFVDPTDPWHPSWYKFKFWSKSGMYNAYRAPGAAITGVSSTDQYIISRSDWADQYTVCIRTTRAWPQVTMTIPTSWPNGTSVAVKRYIDGAADSTETFQFIQDAVTTVSNGQIVYAPTISRYNQFVFTRAGVNPFPTQIVLSSTKTVIINDGVDSTVIKSELRDAANQLVTTAQNTVTFSVTAPGKLPTIYSIPSLNGVATILLTAKGETTPVTVTGKSTGLTDGTVSITLFDNRVSTIIVSANPVTIPADGVSTSNITATLKNKFGTTLSVSNPITFNVTGQGILTSGNTCYSVVNAVAGVATTAVRSTTQFGSINVTAAVSIPVYGIYLKGTASGTGNLFYYSIIAQTSYAIAANDVLMYDIYIPATSSLCNSGLDLGFSDSTYLRETVLKDQNNLSVHPNTDLSAYAFGKWYSRQINISSKAGVSINSILLVLEADSGTNEIVVRNIRVMNGTQVKYYLGDDYFVTLPNSSLVVNGYTNVINDIRVIEYASLQTGVSIPTVQNQATKISCRAVPVTMIADGLTTSVLTADMLNSFNQVVVTATNTVTFSISGQGEAAGTWMDGSVSPQQVGVIQGTATISLKSKTQVGQIIVNSTSAGLTGATVIINVTHGPAYKLRRK